VYFKKNAMNKFCFIFMLMASGLTSFGQFNRYLVQFKDKGNTQFSIANPAAFLSDRALERRTRYQINIDSSDLPVCSNYIDSVRLSGAVRILNTSKWLNQISIETSDPIALAHIQQLPFVNAAIPIASRNSIRQTPKNQFENQLQDIPVNTSKTTVDDLNYGASYGQVKIHQANFLHNHGFKGENMQIAVMDAGFFRYNTLPTFDSLRTNNQILGTWDFVSNETSVGEDDSHGMHCLSTIGANIPGVFVGTAPKTSFYLFRSEDVASEFPIEEHNFAAATEKADSLGVDICSVSLGYSTFDDPAFNYQYSNMDGNTTISAKAADVAAKKGMLKKNFSSFLLLFSCHLVAYLA
jgi:subtilisin family serine protease